MLSTLEITARRTGAHLRPPTWVQPWQQPQPLTWPALPARKLHAAGRGGMRPAPPQGFDGVPPARWKYLSLVSSTQDGIGGTEILSPKPARDAYYSASLG